MKMNKKKAPVLKTILIDLAVIAAINFSFTYFFELGRVMSGSMEPNMMTGDLHFAVRMTLLNDNQLGRGDIITFTRECDGDEKEYVKRIIGLPGDTISFYFGHVFINGEKLDESEYIADDVRTYCEQAYTVPEGAFFCMGDNRMNSYDSRLWKETFAYERNVIGKVKKVIPFHRVLALLDRNAE